jgi:hypothetical protein
VCLRVSDEEDDPGDQQCGQIALGDGGVGDRVLGRGREKRQGGGARAAAEAFYTATAAEERRGGSSVERRMARLQNRGGGQTAFEFNSI